MLLVEDQRLNLEVYTRALSRRGYDVVAASSAEAARAAIKNQLPDIILLDIFMPKVSGFDFLREIREDPKTSSVPVILISALTDSKHIVAGLEQGANDYVTKPLVIPILTARMEALLRASSMVRHLEVQTELLAKLAAFDELTGVYNRRSMFHTLETELSRSRRYGRSLSVLMLDFDHFKKVNDEYGHAVGDTVLREVAQAVQLSLRAMDPVCRYGGEEFCAILPETNLVGGIRAGERVRACVAAKPIGVGGLAIPVTVSVGDASWTPDESGVTPDLLQDADLALLEAKRAGRNQVRVSEGGTIRVP